MREEERDLMSGVKKFLVVPLLSLVIGLVGLGGANGQFLLPNAKQTFLDANGDPLAAGKVFTYVPNTLTPKTTYQDSALSVPNSNPILLDGAGRAQIWGAGLYREVVQDFNGLQQWDAVTTAASGIAGPGSTNVGDVACWANTTGTLLNDCIALSALAQLVSPNFTGTPTAPTAPPGTNNTQIATTAFVATSFAPLASPALTGVPTAPTAPPNTNTTQIATTAFVTMGLSSLGQPLIGKANSVRITDYTVTNADNHSTIYLNAGGVGNKTLTVSALSAYSDGQFAVRFCNLDSRRWKVSSVDSGVQNLWPGNCNMLTSNTVTLTYDTSVKRYKLSSAVNVNMGPTGACNDVNDGLAVGSGGAICTFSVLFNLIRSEWTCGNGGSITIKYADGTYVNPGVFMYGATWDGCGDQIPITGNIGVPSNVVLDCSSGQTCIDIEDGMITTISGLEVACGNGVGIFARGTGAIVDLNGVLVGSCVGGVGVSVNDGGHVNVLLPGGGFGLQFLGNMSTAIGATGAGSLFSGTSGTINVTSSPLTVSGAFVTAAALGMIRVGPAQISGGGSVTGLKWGADSNGLIYTTGSGVACNSFFNNVGTVNATATAQGLCN